MHLMMVQPIGASVIYHLNLSGNKRKRKTEFFQACAQGRRTNTWMLSDTVWFFRLSAKGCLCWRFGLALRGRPHKVYMLSYLANSYLFRKQTWSSRSLCGFFSQTCKFNIYSSLALCLVSTNFWVEYYFSNMATDSSLAEHKRKNLTLT